MEQSPASSSSSRSLSSALLGCSVSASTPLAPLQNRSFLSELGISPSDLGSVALRRNQTLTVGLVLELERLAANRKQLHSWVQSLRNLHGHFSAEALYRRVNVVKKKVLQLQKSSYKSPKNGAEYQQILEEEFQLPSQNSPSGSAPVSRSPSLCTPKNFEVDVLSQVTVELVHETLTLQSSNEQLQSCPCSFVDF